MAVQTPCTAHVKRRTAMLNGMHDVSPITPQSPLQTVPVRVVPRFREYTDKGETMMNRTNGTAIKKRPRRTSSAPVWDMSAKLPNEITLPEQFFPLPQHSAAYWT